MVGNDESWRPWVPRVLAPLAFFVAATTLVLIVHRSLTADSAANPNPTPTATETTATGNGTTEEGQQGGDGGRRRLYRVRQGDFLETIAQRFDTTVDELLRLNPNVDPNSLRPGQRIRVR